MMKKTVLISILALLVSQMAVNAQYDSTRSSLGIFFGPGMPQGNYAEAKETNEFAGYAETGLTINLEYTYHFYRYFGISLKYITGSNNLDEELLHDDMEEVAIDTGNPSNATYTFDQGKHKWRTFMIGPVAYWFEDNYVISARLLAGNIRLILPEYESTIDYDKTDNRRLQYSYSSKSDNFGFMIGAGIQIFLTKKIDFAINVDYINTQMNYNVRTINTFNEDIEEVKVKRTQPFSIININGGFVIHFFKKNKKINES